MLFARLTLATPEHFSAAMKEPDSWIRLPTPFVLPLMTYKSSNHQLKDLATHLVQAKIQTDCEISQTRHAREGGEAGDNAPSSSLHPISARREADPFDVACILHRRCQVPVKQVMCDRCHLLSVQICI